MAGPINGPVRPPFVTRDKYGHEWIIDPETRHAVPALCGGDTMGGYYSAGARRAEPCGVHAPAKANFCTVHQKVFLELHTDEKFQKKYGTAAIFYCPHCFEYDVDMNTSLESVQTAAIDRMFGEELSSSEISIFRGLFSELFSHAVIIEILKARAAHIV